MHQPTHGGQLGELVHRLEDAINTGDAHAICFEIYAARDTIYQGTRQGRAASTP
jgi:hypothetical protein